VPVQTGDLLDGGDSFFFGLMGEHGSGDNVSDSVDVGHGGLPGLVGFDQTSVSCGQTGLLQVEA